MTDYRTKDIPSGTITVHTSLKRLDTFLNTRRPGVVAVQLIDHLPVVDVLILDAEGYKAFLEQTATEGAVA